MSTVLSVQEPMPGLDEDTPDSILNEYIGPENIEKFHSQFHRWFSELGYKDTEVFAYSLGKTANMAHNMKDEYDISVGIAKGGLFSAYIFSKFGIHTKLAEAHAGTNNKTFEWIDDVIPEEIEGKRVLVLENDLISGETSRKVLEVLQKYRPGGIDISFNVDPHGGKYGYGTIVENIPYGYGRVHFPSNFGYGKFNDAIRTVKESIV